MLDDNAVYVAPRASQHRPFSAVGLHGVIRTVASLLLSLHLDLLILSHNTLPTYFTLVYLTMTHRDANTLYFT